MLLFVCSLINPLTASLQLCDHKAEEVSLINPLTASLQLCDHKAEEVSPLDDTPPVNVEFFVPNLPSSLTETSEPTVTSTSSATCEQTSEKTGTLKISGRRSGSSSPAKAGSLKREDGHVIPKTLQQEFSLVNLSIPNMTVERVSELLVSGLSGHLGLPL